MSLLTEQEALEKWCPFVRLTPETENVHPITNRGVAVRRDCIGESLACCIASKCMAWRWQYERDQERDRSPSGATPFRPSPWGYCGLAGEPR